jgi:polysaccharide deacetylase 2 family uncharacterized protein YibQ
MSRSAFKSLMTLMVSGGLLLTLGVALGAWWFAPGRDGDAHGPIRPSLVLMSPLAPGSEPAPSSPEPARAPSRNDQRPNPPGRDLKPGHDPGSAAGPARLAIVIDDLGYNLTVPERLVSLGAPLTFSIIPGQPYSSEVAALARRAGREFLVHLPMEPLGFPADDPGPNALLLDIADEATRAQVSRQLDSLPGAAGANNHMGSAFTADARKMAIVQEQIARRGLLFLNSKTAPWTVPRRIAHEHGYAYLERDVFLDNERGEAAIRGQLDTAIRRARERGRAVAIGHPYPETVRVLGERVPRLAREGVILVPVSELAD